MSEHATEGWRHDHDFLPEDHGRGERATRFVIALTAVVMVLEIAAGSVFNSMALLADGWHMGSHASALGITALAYWFARRHRGSARFSFGAGKVGVLGGFTSAVVLALIALLVAWESVGRFFDPREIGFDEAIAVAGLGLLVNVYSAWLLRDGHSHGHDRGHGPHHDHNLRAAYLHVLADALTSVTAIVALTAGKYLGWGWMDPMMGIVGSAVIARWSFGLLRETSVILLDGSASAETRRRLRERLEADGHDRVCDLHVWCVGPDRLAAIVSLASALPKTPDAYRAMLREVVDLAHVSIEVNRWPERDARAPAERKAS